MKRYGFLALAVLALIEVAQVGGYGDRCGTFCAADQTAPAWPYGYCDDYWLRPDTNY